MATYYTALETLHDRLLTARSDGSFSVADRLENRLNEIYGYFWRYNLAVNESDTDGQSTALAGLISEFALEDLVVDPTSVLQARAAYIAPSTYFVAIPTDVNGDNGDFTNASVDLNVFLNGVDDTANWSFAKVDTNVTSVIVANTLSISAISADNGNVVITASRTGYNDRSISIYVSKVKQGETGTASSSTGIDVLYPSSSIVAKRILAFRKLTTSDTTEYDEIIDLAGLTNFLGTVKVTTTFYQVGNQINNSFIGQKEIVVYFNTDSFGEFSLPGAPVDIYERIGSSITGADIDISGSTTMRVAYIGLAATNIQWNTVVEINGVIE